MDLSSLVLCNRRAHNLVIKCPAFKESQPVKKQKTRSSNAKSGYWVKVNRPSGLAGIYKAPRNLEQIGANTTIVQTNFNWNS
jgi:hypothetical protein